MIAFVAAALVGVLHVHHAPSHDSDAPFEAVVAAAAQARLDFVVLTEHVPEHATGPLPAAERAGLYRVAGERKLLVLVGGEFGTSDGHLLGYGLPHAVAPARLDGPQAIAAIRAAGGFAVVPHPFRFGGWRAWDADFDGIEVHNNASLLRGAVGPALPLRVLRLAWDRPRAYAALLERPARALRRWDEVRANGRSVVAYSGVDVHQNVSLLGWQIDPYVDVFRTVQTVCPAGPLDGAHIWAALRAGRCDLRWTAFEARADEAREVHVGDRVELQLDDGRRVLEIRQPRD